MTWMRQSLLRYNTEDTSNRGKKKEIGLHQNLKLLAAHNAIKEVKTGFTECEKIFANCV